MQPHLKKILVVDHDLNMRQIFVGLLRSQCGFFHVLSAGSLQSAMQIISTNAIDMVITGLNLAEIAGLHLIERLIEVFPDKKIIHMTSPSRQLVRSKIGQHPLLLHFDQTQNLNLLTRRICLELGIDYGGQLRGIGLSSFLQLLELDGRSCTLRISAKGKVGYLAIKDGLLINACREDQDNDDIHETALHIMSWGEVIIEIDFSLPQVSEEISEPLTMMMLESGRIDDEQQSQQAEQRQHQRYLAPVALDYCIDEATYQCFLRDISLGGAYTETEQDIAIGNYITLTLTLVQTKRSHAFKGIVVRKDQKGVGIRFAPMNLGEQKIIQSFITENVQSDAIADEMAPAAELESNEPPGFLKSVLEEHSEESSAPGR